MTAYALSTIDVLEQRLAGDPDSEFLRQQLLAAYLQQAPAGHPRRVEHILEYVRRYPRSVIARSEYAHVYLDDCPEGFERVEEEWLELSREHPADPEIARGLALFIASNDPERALDVLREAQRANPEDAELWMEMGRLSTDPSEALGCLQRAHQLGSTQPNLLVWIGRAAIEAGALQEAERIGRQLLGLVEEARATHGERLDWPDRGQDLWMRASEACPDRHEARELVGAITDHANRKHWGHTFLGIVAERAGDMLSAREHLRHSAEVVGEPRLWSYGPSLELADELLRRGEWDVVADYLRACRAFWNSPDLERWIAAVEQRERPEFRNR